MKQKNTTRCLVAALPAVALVLAAVPASAEPVGPTAPASLVASAGPGAGAISLAWEPAASLLGVSAYRVYRAADDGSFLLLAEVPADQLGYVDAGLANGATYAYAVSATDVLAEGPLSDPASATTFTVPEAPAGVAVASGPGAVGEATLTWSPPERDGGLPVTGYVVYRDGAAVAFLDASAASWTDAGLTPLHAYAYAVSATNAAGEGPQSEAACGMASPWVAGLDCATVL